MADQFLQFLALVRRHKILLAKVRDVCRYHAPIEPHYDQLRHQVLTEKPLIPQTSAINRPNSGLRYGKTL
ncbi:hypothetical protein INT80_14040 [Gallibacterium anatis]|uniref:Uncharacterized protein n=1 Tax=Gallibacterium anatis TaxID=750 RepID=A0A930YAX7_9PAST|nr:hypothetical protein [Gallibacterium anatis]